jgi:hypothetical protein
MNRHRAIVPAMALLLSSLIAQHCDPGAFSAYREQTPVVVYLPPANYPYTRFGALLDVTYSPNGDVFAVVGGGRNTNTAVIPVYTQGAFASEATGEYVCGAQAVCEQATSGEGVAALPYWRGSSGCALKHAASGGSVLRGGCNSIAGRDRGTIGSDAVGIRFGIDRSAMGSGTGDRTGGDAFHAHDRSRRSGVRHRTLGRDGIDASRIDRVCEVRKCAGCWNGSG